MMELIVGCVKMRNIIIALCGILILSGCFSIKRPTPILNVYGESDYLYIRAGLMWGTSLKDYVASLEEEDFIRGESGSDSGPKGKGGGSSCGNGGCSL